MNIANIKYNSVGNWYGISTSVYVSGCNHCCDGCFSKETWNKNYGYEYTKEIEDNIIESLKPRHIKTLVLLGGEPFMDYNVGELTKLCIRAKEEVPGINIVAYTGNKIDILLTKKAQKGLISHLNVLIDDKFRPELYNPNLKFKGSSNQRTIDVQATLEKGEVVLYEGFES